VAKTIAILAFIRFSPNLVSLLTSSTLPLAETLVRSLEEVVLSALTGVLLRVERVPAPFL
jgi:hypothetical protein